MKKQDRKEKAFNNWKHNAVHLTFPNGNSISTIWGYCTYSDNHDFEGEGIEAFQTFMQSDTCEVMILNAPNKLTKKIHKKFDSSDDSVIGYLTMTDWLWIIKMLSK